MLLPFFIHVIKFRTIKCLPIFVTFGEFMIILDIKHLLNLSLKLMTACIEQVFIAVEVLIA